MPEKFNFEVEADCTGSRIDLFVADKLQAQSRSFVQKLINGGNVLVNGTKIKSNYKLRKEDAIEVNLPEPEVLEIKPEDIPLDIVYEDKDLIVIHKPKDMVVHPAPGHFSGTVVNALLYHCGSNLSGINGVLRPGIVHRIDKDTSGLIVAAKNDIAHQSLSKQFAEHSIERTYNAIVFGNLKEEMITVDKPIARHTADRKKMAVSLKSGKRAVTHLKVIQRYGKYTLIEASLETGRTHQIRVHAAYLGHPILGDKVYGPEKQPYKLQGQALHAKTLGFIHPTKEEYIHFTSPLPEYFVALLYKLNQVNC